MRNDMYRPEVENNEFSSFAYFFVKYLNGSASQNEAFLRAKSAYRRYFKKIPYANFKSFLAEFNKSRMSI